MTKNDKYFKALVGIKECTFKIIDALSQTEEVKELRLELENCCDGEILTIASKVLEVTLEVLKSEESQ